ncbi:MAG: hypothetical protein KIH01_05315, partial [Candidatus Freyarchaeota archaeon]|nr:hypothetical protein [Candidatus Jordarchaeia archaeon]
MRAKVACKVLRLAGRVDVPVIVGLGEPLSRYRNSCSDLREKEYWRRGDANVPMSLNVAEFLASKCTSGTVLLAIGPLTND